MMGSILFIALLVVEWIEHFCHLLLHQEGSICLYILTSYAHTADVVLLVLMPSEESCKAEACSKGEEEPRPSPNIHLYGEASPVRMSLLTTGVQVGHRGSYLVEARVLPFAATEEPAQPSLFRFGGFCLEVAFRQFFPIR